MGNLKERIYQNSTDERVILLLTISVFISVYVTGAMMLFVVAYLIKEKRITDLVSSTPGIQYLWALCALGVAVALANHNKIGALISAALVVFFLIGAFARSVMTRGLFNKIVQTACAASIISFVVALVQYATFQDEINRSSSAFLNPNYYATVIEIVVLFAVYNLCRTQNRKQQGFYAVVIGLNAIGLYYTGCRTALFALFAAVLLMLLLNKRYKVLAAFVGMCAALVLAMVALPGVFPRMDEIGADMGTRIAIWRTALKAILSHPIFGDGAYAFTGFKLVLCGATIVHAHSIYLEPLLSFGILGTGLILVYLKKNLTPIWQMRQVKSDRGKFVLTAGLLTSVGLHGAVDATAFSIQVGVLLLLALAVAGIQEKRVLEPVRIPVHPIAYLSAAASRRPEVGSVVKSASYISKKSA